MAAKGLPLKETVAKGIEPSHFITQSEYFESSPAKKKQGYEITVIFPVMAPIIPIINIAETV